MASENLPHCAGCGAAPFTAEGVGRWHCSACGFTLYRNAVAAVAVLVEDRGRLLVAVRGRDPGQGLLDLPGGFVDPGEDAETAARREVAEELSVSVTSLRYVDSAANHYPYGGVVYRTLDLAFAATVSDPDAVAAADDVAGLRWLTRDEIRSDAFAFAFTSIRRFVTTWAASAT